MIYKRIVRPLLYSFDPETIHDLLLNLFSASQRRVLCNLISASTSTSSEALRVKAFGLEFSNPVGLAAGFDKNCRIFEFLSALGFGHVEVGTITLKEQTGNPRPRIFRLPVDEALINRMGFPSEGASVIADRLACLYRRKSILGINIGKSKDASIELAVEDYVGSFKLIHHYADYVAINVSSPNTPDLRKLQEKSRLSELISSIQLANIYKKPLLIKLAPDLSLSEIDDVVEVALANSVAGLIATNTTLSRDGLSVPTTEQGGLSGKPLRSKSLDFVRYLYKMIEGKIPIIGAGGVFSAEDAYALIQGGASLIQIYTGLIYEGPSIVKNINRGLVKLISNDGLRHIGEAVGVNSSH